MRVAAASESRGRGADGCLAAVTLTGSRRLGARLEYTLGYPNLEVEAALNDSLAKAMIGDPGRASELASRLYDVLVSGDFAGLRPHVQALFAAVPHHWHDNNPTARNEGFYASIFYSQIAALGLDLTPEDATAHGRIDLTLRFEAQVWLFEFKVVELAPEGRALQPLKDRGYADKYRALGQPIHLIRDRQRRLARL